MDDRHNDDMHNTVVLHNKRAGDNKEALRDSIPADDNPNRDEEVLLAAGVEPVDAESAVSLAMAGALVVDADDPVAAEDVAAAKVSPVVVADVAVAAQVCEVAVKVCEVAVKGAAAVVKDVAAAVATQDGFARSPEGRVT